MRPIFQHVRNMLRLVGFDVISYSSTKINHLSHFLKKFNVNIVIDVGANEGQYAMRIRNDGYTGHILSFEPNSLAFKRLLKNASTDNKWKCHNFALGDKEQTAILNLTELDVYSSLLPITSDLESLDHRANVVKKEPVVVKTIDGIWDIIDLQSGPIFLKIDTQGYEKEVLSGAKGNIHNFIGIQVEMSLHRTYSGQPQIEEMIPFMYQQGFELFAIWDGFSDPRSGQILEVDGLFFRALANKESRYRY